MGRDVGNTTVAEKSHSSARGVPDLALVWLFPRPGEPHVNLTWDGRNELVMGRDAGCTVHLDGSEISRRHAALQRSGPGSRPVIRDLESRNGVRINGHLVATATLDAGDVVRLGGWVGVVTSTPGNFTEIASGLFGGAALLAALLPLRTAAQSDPIVLEGETGTGKEMVARSLHQWSKRAGPLVAVNCGALPEGLAEAELFGYRRGAFTGADRASAGFFRSAEGGTLLLDEVSDLPLPLQAKLLRVLEERKVQPLGETRPVAIDVRVVVAGQQSLIEGVRRGQFRADLLARLDGLTVHLPPLRRRREDVPPLFFHLLRVLGQGLVPAIEADFIERLCLYDWPFNVRELVLLVRRLLALHGGESILRTSHLPERIRDLGVRPALSDGSPPGTILGFPALKSAGPDRVELPALLGALRASSGNVAEAAAILGITRQRAYRLMEGKGIDLETLRKQ
jgi:DNA-binding NtrC family response regulator